MDRGGRSPWITSGEEMKMSKTVLVVDDSRMSRMMISTIIRTHQPDWKIMEAEDAVSALKICESKAIDFATLDMNMPGMNGVTLGIELRKRFPSAHLTMLTANVQSAIRQKAEAAKIGFIDKPVTEEKIVNFIRAEVST